MQVLGQLKNACLEVLSSDPSGPTAGRIWFNTTTNQVRFDTGSGITTLVDNSRGIIVGTSGTESENIRLTRAGNGLLQVLRADDVTPEGSQSTTLAELSSRLEGYLDAGLPAFGNVGRLVYVTDLNLIKVDTGTSWAIVGAGVTSASNVGGFVEVFKDLVGTDLRFRTFRSTDGTIEFTQNADDIDFKQGPKPLQSVEFTTSGTWDVPTGITSVLLYGCGGGGGGGSNSALGVNYGPGGGGGGAACVWQFVDGLTPGDTITITIGAGGAGGAASALGNPGGTGGTTSFGAFTTFFGATGGGKNNFDIGAIFEPDTGIVRIGAFSSGYAPRYVPGGYGRGGGTLGGGTVYSPDGFGGHVPYASSQGQSSVKFTGGVTPVVGQGGGGGSTMFGVGGAGGNPVPSSPSATSYGAGGGGGGVNFAALYAGAAGTSGYLRIVW